MKKIVLFLLSSIILASCVSKKELEAVKRKHARTKNRLATVEKNLIKCNAERERFKAEKIRYVEKSKLLEANVADLKKDKKETLKQVGDLTVLTKGAQDNIKQTIAQLSKKDAYINRIRAAATAKDSLNLVVSAHLKQALSEGIADQDIEVNVEKTVVFISISDKLLFKSGSYTITDKASQVLAKVAKVVNAQPEMDVMIEGHTDNTPVAKGSAIIDNWGLSVRRSTAIVRELQNKYGVKPSRLIAAGRGSYVPLAPNDSPVNKARNRRTKIIVLPKLNQFFELLDKKVE